MRRQRRYTGAVVLVLTLLAAVAVAQEHEPATAVGDSLAAGEGGLAPADSLVVEAASDSLQTPDGAIAAGGDAGALEPVAYSPSLISAWSHKPRAGLRAEVRLVRYFGEWDENLVFRTGQSLSAHAGTSRQDFRKQDKVIEKRDGRFSLTGGSKLPIKVNVGGDWNWSEDRTVNTAGLQNLNKRDTKNLRATASQRDIETLFLLHDVSFTGRINDQKGENQNQVNNLNSAEAYGNWQMRFGLLPGVRAATRLYHKQAAGKQTLGNDTKPSSADGDTLGGGIYYQRRHMTGHVTATLSSFHKYFLDYRRNANGLIDTLNIPEGEPRVVNEIATDDKVALEWQNELRLAGVTFRSKLSRDFDYQDYAFSGVGRRDRHADAADFSLLFAAGVDSFALRFDYTFKWDDQQQKGATQARGKKYNKRRGFGVDWIRELFRHTQMTTKFNQNLSQDIAEDQFDQNDRDRLQTDFSVRVRTTWSGFRTNLVFSFKQTQDISLRATRSSNNSIKSSYEVSPGYVWPVTRWFNLQQTFRVYIQYTDFDFGYLDWVSKTDNYNKRGNLTTMVTLNPSRRLRLTIKHDYNQKFNATRTGADAVGSDFYRIDQEQTINKVDLGFTFKAAQWLTLEGATGRTHDLRDNIGTTTRTTETFGGMIWVGMGVRRKVGSVDINGTVRSNFAYGPNVTETNERYWDADVAVTWSF